MCPGPTRRKTGRLGNTYTDKRPDPVVKHRNMTNVIHTWGIYRDPAAKRVYAAVGQHAGDNKTFYGGVFISDDECESWTVVSDPKHTLGDYRTYDIMGFAGKLYATVNDQYERQSLLAVSSDGGASWKRIHMPVESRTAAVRDGQLPRGARLGP